MNRTTRAPGETPDQDPAQAQGPAPGRGPAPAQGSLRAAGPARARAAALDVAGEGAIAGLAAGCVLGGWDVYLNADLSHGMPMMAAWRMLGPAVAGTAIGIAASFAVAGVLEALRRVGRRAAIAGVFCFALSGAGAAGMVAFPLRRRALPLVQFSPHSLAIAMYALLVLFAVALLLARSSAFLPWNHGRIQAAAGRARRIGGRWGIAAGALVAFLWLVQPVLATLRAKGRPSVILVSFDTLRADRLGVLGCPRPLTPNLDSLANEGVLFEQASSASSWTLPAHVSLFSSLLPFDHRTRWDHDRIRLSETFPGEHFREAGYRCAAVTGGGYVSSVYGYAQGCELYENHDEVKEGGPRRIAASALSWVRAHRRSPFFLFVHTYEAHLPFTNSEYATPGMAGRIDGFLNSEQDDAIHDGKLVLTEEERARVRDLYDGDVASADRVIGGMLRQMKREGILDHAILVVVSDHGEDLWDHDQTWSPGHGHTLYQEVIHVPLIVRAPGLVASGVRIHTPVSLLDVAPTILALAGLPPDRAYEGRDLSNACRTGTEPPVAPIRAESMQFGPDRFAIRQGNLKIILVPTPNRKVATKVIDPARPLEIFDLAADPGERVNLAGPLPDSVRALVRLAMRRADDALFAGQSPADKQRKLPPELIEQLHSLGYVN